MSKRTAYGSINRLKIPAKAKAALRRLWRSARRICEAVIGFVKSHRWLTDALALSVAIVFLWSAVPLLCAGMALLLVTSATLELCQKLRGGLAQHFKEVV